MYEVVSGHEAGHLYHDYVFRCKNEEEARECIKALDEYANRQQTQNWVWGPQMWKKADTCVPIHWNGYQEVDAPWWSGTLNIVSCEKCVYHGCAGRLYAPITDGNRMCATFKSVSIKGGKMSTKLEEAVKKRVEMCAECHKLISCDLIQDSAKLWAKMMYSQFENEMTEHSLYLHVYGAILQRRDTVQVVYAAHYDSVDVVDVIVNRDHSVPFEEDREAARKKAMDRMKGQLVQDSSQGCHKSVVIAAWIRCYNEMDDVWEGSVLTR